MGLSSFLREKKLWSGKQLEKNFPRKRSMICINEKKSILLSVENLTCTIFILVMWV
jgi:hypothetical protein